jgi:flavin reductase (DIM6/NTAB) family NADH-FMN oxidoreductase RutF
MGERAPLGADRLNLAWKFFQPSVPVLVTTMNADGSVNIAPFGWVTPVSAEPPLVGLALRGRPRRNLTLQNILREGEFVVNMVGAELADRLVKCSHKLPPGMSKFDASGFEATPSSRVKPPGIRPARTVVECRLNTTVSPGDHTIVVGEVVAASFDAGCFTDDLVLRPERSFPCLHLEQYDRADGQLHLFLGPAPVREVKVDFEHKFDVVAAFGNGETNRGE